MRFSARLPKDLAPNNFTRILQQQQKDGKQIFDLTVANPTQVDLPYPPIAGCFKEASTLQPYHPTPQGSPAARLAISEYYQTNGYGTVQCQDLFLTASTSEAYSFLMKLLTDPGDEILVPAPSYPLFDFLASLDNVRTSHYQLQQDDNGRWHLDFSSLARELSPITRAIVVVSPNNPTGSYLSGEDMRQLSALCAANNLALIVDEVFLDYSTKHQTTPRSAINNDSALTFTLSGFSKILALPQVKLSWIHISGPLEEKEAAKARLEFITDTYLSVNSMIEQAAPSLLAQQQAIQGEIQHRLQCNERQVLDHAEINMDQREGGWYAVINLPPEISDEECCLALLQADNVLVHPGYFYDFTESNRLVVSLLTPPVIFHHGLQCLETYIRSR